MDFEKLRQQIQEEREIKCPFCFEIQLNDDNQYPVSYWGSEDGAEEWECIYCEKKFFIKEEVERTYEVKKTIKDFDYQPNQ